MHPNNAKVAIEAWSRIDRGIPMSEVLAALEVKLICTDGCFAIVDNLNSMPDFTAEYEYRIKHVNWRHIAEFEKHADDPDEYRNWEILHNNKWYRLHENPEFFSENQYRRNPLPKPLPKPDKYGWMPIDSVPFGVEVDLYDTTDEILSIVGVILISTTSSFEIKKQAIHCTTNKNVGTWATHWRPSTGRPE